MIGGQDRMQCDVSGEKGVEKGAERMKLRGGSESRGGGGDGGGGGGVVYYAGTLSVASRLSILAAMDWQMWRVRDLECVL